MEQDDKNERKERVIHTRVPPSLDSELKERAERLGTSVSNLVRNILHHAFGLAGDVIRDGQAIARTARGEDDASYFGPAAPTPQAAVPARLLGWQRLTLGMNALCDRCNAVLPKATEAHIGVLDGPGPRPFCCDACLEEVTRAR